MTAARVGAGILVLTLCVVGLTAAARRARSAALPGADPATALVADAVLALAGLLAIAHVLGAFDLLAPLPIAVACALAWVAAWRLLPPPPRADRVRGRPSLLAAVPVALVAVVWLGRSIETLQRGVAGNLDTNWYHLPFAARFVEAGIGGLYRSLEPIVPLYPADASLLHAVGLAFTGTDVLSPLLNLAFAALALAAAHALGRISGAGPVVVAATAFLLLTRALASTQPGEGKDDVMALALLLAGAALVAAASPAAAGIGALALGMAIGTKLSAIPAAVVVAAGALVLVPRSDRRRTAGLVAAGLLATGATWYIRNLVETGSPVPMVALPGWDPPPSPALDGPSSLSVAHYVTDLGIWRDWFVPALSQNLGPLWFVAAAAGAAGAIAGIVRGGPARVLGTAAVVALAGFVVAPHMAGGPDRPYYIGHQLRHAFPALALGLAAGAWSLGRVRGRWLPAGAAALAMVAAVDLGGAWPAARPTVAAVAVLVTAAIAVAAAPPRRRGAAACLVLAALAVLAGMRYRDAYLRGDYESGPLARLGSYRALAPAFDWARTVEDARIGVVGTVQHYPLFGAERSNHVSQVGVPGPRGAFSRPAGCAEFAAAVARERFRYVLTAPIGVEVVRTATAPREGGWLAASPSAAPVVDEGTGVALYRLDGPVRCG